MDKNPTTPAAEVNNTEVKPAEVTPEVTTEGESTPETKAQTMEEVLGTPEPKQVETVPLKTFLDMKKENRVLAKKFEELKNQVTEGATLSEVSAELKAISEEYDVDAGFLSKLSAAIYKQAKDEATETLNSKLGPIEAKDKAARIDKAFNEHYENIIVDLPEYANIINKDVIKTLSLLPENSKKTFQQIIEDTYGKTVPGKKTLEDATPRGGKDVSLDMKRTSDPEYFKQIMANPELKKEYNKNITDRINL
jgi:hypothetical protein